MLERLIYKGKKVKKNKKVKIMCIKNPSPFTGNPYKGNPYTDEPSEQKSKKLKKAVIELQIFNGALQRKSLEEILKENGIFKGVKINGNKENQI